MDHLAPALPHVWTVEADRPLGKWYTFRSTLDKLSDHLNSIESDGDTVLQVEHVGGRDWVILCRKGVR